MGRCSHETCLLRFQKFKNCLFWKIKKQKLFLWELWYLINFNYISSSLSYWYAEEGRMTRPLLAYSIWEIQLLNVTGCWISWGDTDSLMNSYKETSELSKSSADVTSVECISVFHLWQLHLISQKNMRRIILTQHKHKFLSAEFLVCAEIILTFSILAWTLTVQTLIVCHF